MLFKITQIEFDFIDDNDAYAVSLEEQISLTDEVIGSVWEADDDEDLVEELTCAHGWCIKRIDYVNVLS